MKKVLRLTVLLGFATICMAIFPSTALATFSIVACSKDGSCGVAVATNNLAVGASVSYARAGVGAMVTQFETNPEYGPKGLQLLSAGASPEDAVKTLLAGDGNFDGTTIAERQVGMADVRGRSFAYTGEQASRARWAGARHGDGYSIQGNGLTSEKVISAMEKVFLASGGTLAERLMASLEAGQAAGGQTIGKLSAALLLKTPDGVWQDIDLRVDGAAEPIRDLHRLMDQHYAFDAILRAERQVKKGMLPEARLSIAEALHRSGQWDRIWRRAARLAMGMGDTGRALDYLGVFTAINPVWAKEELQDEIYRPLYQNALFASWAAKLGAEKATPTP
ncbi:DUF1028 domain-containing protein [Undibacterium sp. TJN25]|uniref:DUF1028 domain-containing protein n=1 Tax=Undibacterium sp. TJN25 TaxID=3413056 RepID=UPI003BF1CB21